MRTTGAKRILPIEIPPVIQATGILPPERCFDEQELWWQIDDAHRSAVKAGSNEKTIDALQELLTQSERIGKKLLGGVSEQGRALTADALLYEASNAQAVSFLQAYRGIEADYTYPERRVDAALQIEFLQ